MSQQCSHCGEENADSAAVCSVCSGTLAPKTEAALLLDNRYEIITTVKSGGMGCIYRARDTRLNNLVAVKKMLSPSVTSDEMAYFEQRFKEEARLLSQLHHGGLPKVIDFFIATDRSTRKPSFYLVMTFVEGKDLESISAEQEESIPLNTALDYFTQICEILNYLHSQKPPVVYRDLKPSNIMLKEGKVFLVDFGIARIFDRRQTETPALIGTPGYAPPEQYDGFSEPRSDLYSLAVVMHQLLTGRKSLEDSQDLFSFEPPGTINPQVTPLLDRLIMSMLDVDINKRPASAQKALDVLSVMTGRSPHAKGKLERIKLPDIFEAVEKNDIEEVKRQLEKDLKKVMSRNKEGFTLIHIAVNYGATEMIELLLSRGSPVNGEDSEGMPPLHHAARGGFEPAVLLLLDYGAAVDAGAKNGSTPLHYAAEEGHVEVAAQLISHGADINAKAHNGWTPLHNAACYGHLKIAELLMERGARVNESNNFGWTPLHWATDRGHKEVAQALLLREADAKAQASEGATPLHWAAKKGYIEIADTLLSYGGDINGKDNEGWTPLHWATDSGNREMVEYLLSKGARISALDKHGRLAEAIAREKHHWELEKFLNTYGQAPLQAPRNIFDAISKNDVAALDNFIFMAVGIDAKNRHGWTPLHWAIESGHFEMVRMLVMGGADLNVRAFGGATPFHWVARKGNKKMAALLLQYKSSMEARDDHGQTPLHWAIAHKNIAVLELLIGQGAQVNVIDESGKIPLQLAIEQGSEEMVKILLERSNQKDL